MKNIISTDLDPAINVIESPSTTCPRYEACNSNVCPIDNDWHLRTHIAGDRVCYYLRLVAKDQTQGLTSDNNAEPAYAAAMEVWAVKDRLPTQLQTALQQIGITPKRTYANRFQAA